MRDDPYWTSREDSLELIELSSINKVRPVSNITFRMCRIQLLDDYVRAKFDV